MKKSSLETLLLLSNIQNKNQIAQFCKDIKALDSEVLGSLLTSLETYKEISFRAATERFTAKLEEQKAKLEEQRARAQAELEKHRLEAETQKREKEEIKRSADQVLHLLLKRSKL